MRTLAHILDKIFAGCCCTILAIVVFCVTWQVIARLIFNAPSTTLDGLTQVLFVRMILLGDVYIAGLKKHLTIDSLAQKLPAASVLMPDGLVQIIVMVFAIIFMIYGGNIVVGKA